MGYIVRKIVLLLIIHLITPVRCGEGEDPRVDVEDTLVWGPGLLGSFAMPVRYFYIQAVDQFGKNFTSSVGEKAFSVSIYQTSGARVRVHLQVLDRQDGSYIVRYKLYESTYDIMVDVLHQGRHVGQSPYKLAGPVYTEKCYCPVKRIERWLGQMDCPDSYSQIKRDLARFSDQIDMSLVAPEAVQRFNQRGRHSLCHYVVKDNKVYRKTYGQHVGFKMFMDAVLLSLTRKVILPDFEFFVNLGDWPLVKKDSSEGPLPIFSWCGSEDTLDIVMPTYDVTEATLETMGRVSLDLLSVQANTGPPWENKTSLGFWRGRDSRQERLDLVKLSHQHPELIDAKLTNMFFFKHNPEEHGEIVKHISFFDFFNHKYQISVDGTVAAYRLPYLLAGDSVVLKQDSPYFEHFYHDLERYQHYIPVKRDLSDLLDQLQWAKDHDEEACKIALRAQAYVRDNLMARDVFCYHAILFKEYAKKLKKKPKVGADMELVEQPSDHDAQCDCHRNRAKVSGQVREEL